MCTNTTPFFRFLVHIYTKIDLFIVVSENHPSFCVYNNYHQNILQIVFVLTNTHSISENYPSFCVYNNSILLNFYSFCVYKYYPYFSFCTDNYSTFFSQFLYKYSPLTKTFVLLSWLFSQHSFRV